MIEVPTILKVIVVVAAIVTFAAGLANGEALMRHLRDHHAPVLRKLGYPADMGDLVRPDQDSQVAAGDWALWRFLSRREFKDLRDERLNVLAERQRWLLRAGILLLLALGVGLFVVA